MWLLPTRSILFYCTATFLCPIQPADPPDPIARVEQLGGTVEKDNRRPGMPVVAIDFGGCAITDRDLRILRHFPELRRLSLSNTPVTDEGLKHCADLTNIRFLDLNRTKVSSKGMKNLRRMKSLDTLALYGTALDDEGLKEVADCEKLGAVVLSETRISDRG